ncbi:hypothetical protein [Amycolatopsis sp. H20-H5]|uniref:hypothetical protein n=1 Tax=Amycolatopsis sp. H20-H5 TaxID=3046309 RepID=UPI002DB7E2A9|nr:hypothetical protein [Amycolatopsis sp. H20-H5]MEC3974734.1 hypothetical protein [Amycolatopsis sp. H20-H5]
MSDGEFKLAGAYVEIRLKDETSSDEKRIRARLEGESAINWDTALNDPANTEIVKKKVSAGKPVTINADLDDKLAQAKADEFVAKRRNAVIDLDANIAQLRTKLDELSKKRGVSVEVDADIRKAEAELAALTARRRTMQLEVQAKTKPAEDEISRLAARANAQFNALVFTGLSVGLPAAAAVGAAGATLSLALLAGGFAALAVAGVASSDRVQSRFSELSLQVRADTKVMAAPLEGEVVGAIDSVGTAWTRLRPQIATAVAGSAPAIRELTGAATDLAEGAMPGLVVAVKSSDAALKGLRTFAGEAGTGLGEFFTNASRGSEAAGRGMVIFGGTVQLLEARLGTLFANLANGSAGPLSQLHAIVDLATGALIDLTAHGSAAISFLTGFGNAGVGTVASLRGLLSLLELLPPGVTQFAGSMTAATMIASKFGIDAGAGFRGLGESVRNAGADMTGAAKAGSKVGTALGGLVAGGLNPAFLAVAALGIGLQILGQKQAEASAKTAEHKEGVRELTQALREDNGVVGEHTSKVNTDALQAKNAAANISVYGGALGVASAAAGGNSIALADLTAKSNTWIASMGQQNMLSDTNIKGLQDISTHLLTTGGSYSDVETKVSGYTQSLAGSNHEAFNQLRALLNGNGAIGEQVRKTAEAQQAQNDYAAAMDHASSVLSRGVTPAAYAASVATVALKEDFAKLAATGGDVATKGQAIIDVMRRLAGQAPTVEEALQAWNDDLRGIGEAFKKLDIKNHAKDLIDSSGAINTVTEAGSKLQDTVEKGANDFAAYSQSLKDAGAPADEIRGKLVGMRDEFTKQLKQLGLNDTQIGKVLDHYGMLPDKVVTQLGLEGDTETQNKIAGVVAQIKSIPDTKGVHVDALTGPAVKALQELGYKVVQLPDGSFQVFSNTAPAQQAAVELLNNINHSESTVTVHADTGDATGSVQVWQQKADGTVGLTTTDTRVDPASNKLQVWAAQANGTYAWTTTDSRLDPATGKLQAWVRQADGTVGWVNAEANTSAAERALNNTARDRTSTINVGVNYRDSIRVPGTNITMNAEGNYYGANMGFADGGFPAPTGSNSFNGLAQVVPPGTYKWAGDATTPEVFAPLNGSERTAGLLTKAAQHEGLMGPRGGTTVTNNITIHTIAQDPRALAAAVSGELSWSMRGV